MANNKEAKAVYWLDSSLYLNITNKCSNSCYFCLRRYRRGVGGFNLRLTHEPTFSEITKELSQVLHMQAWDSLVFCGFGEPTERLDVLLEIARWVRQEYGRQLEIRLNTNGQGYRINPERNVVIELKDAGVNKVSVSLNAGDKETYNEICKPIFPEAFDEVLRFISRAKSILNVEVTAVRLPEVDLLKVETLANELGVKLKVRDHIPCLY